MDSALTGEFNQLKPETLNLARGERGQRLSSLLQRPRRSAAGRPGQRRIVCMLTRSIQLR